jgi:diacylglycerol kinase
VHPKEPSQRRAASRWASFRYAWAGGRHAVGKHPNARIHAAATLAVTGLGLWLGLGRTDWCVLVLTIALVWVAELANTALEAAVDLASPDIHPLARTAKDVAATAVLVSAAAAVLVGVLLFGPLLWERFRAGSGSG